MLAEKEDKLDELAANNKLIATERDQLKAALAQRTVSTPNGDQSQGEMVLNQSVSSAP